MSTSDGSSAASRRMRVAQVIIVSSVMFTFISYWRTAAVVLCDLASTAYYIGGIVEHAIGPAAPVFIMAVMVFSYAVRSVYIESCSMFVRGGVYRVVKEAMGGLMAKVAVSALMFDYILTGPISSVSAGHYIIGLGLQMLSDVGLKLQNAGPVKSWGSVVIACGITVYFFRQNLRGIHESSGKALKIMIAMSIMAAIMLAWCGLTLAVDGARNGLTWQPDFSAKPNPTTGHLEDPLGFLSGTGIAGALQSKEGVNWLSLIGLFGLAVAFGHSILAMSGEETLAQVYREVQSPKLPNFQKAAFIVFVFSLVVTGGFSFLAVLLIPEHDRTHIYADNLIGGLSMSVWGPQWAKLVLNAFVVVIGSLILSGAVNTAIIGSNGVLSRVAEDGVVPDWLLRPHPKYGTNYRILYLILGLQLFTIVASRGDVLILGEAYAFGVIWSFVFNSLSMLVLRFKRPGHRDYKVPLNIRIAGIEIPIGLGLIFGILIVCAIVNLLTKSTATVWGLGFTTGFMTVFMVTEYIHERRRRGAKHEHLEQFNRSVEPEVSEALLELDKPHRRLVAIRSPQNLFMLEKSLAETDPATTDVVVMTAKMAEPGNGGVDQGANLDKYDQQLMTAVVERAERAGKEVKPLIVSTNNPLHALLQTAAKLKAQELVIGASNKYTAEEQLDQVSFYWINLHGGQPAPLTVRILSRYRDVTFDLGGGNRIPKLGERQARSVAELRAAGVGVDRMLIVHDGTAPGSELYRSVLTMVDPEVILDILALVTPEQLEAGQELIRQDQEKARKLGREVGLLEPKGDWGETLVRVARENAYDLIVVALPPQETGSIDSSLTPWLTHLIQHAPCKVCCVVAAVIPKQVDE